MEEEKINSIQVYHLIGKIEGKIDGINQRLDSMNGSLRKHDEDIDINRNDITILKTKATIYGGFAGFIVSLLLFIANYFLSK